MAYDPIILFKLLMLKSKYELSDRDLMDHARTDMTINFFLDLSPEDNIPHHTTRVKDLLKSKTKTYSLRNPALIHQEQLEFEETKEFKKTYISGFFGMRLQSAVVTCNKKNNIFRK